MNAATINDEGEAQNDEGKTMNDALELSRACQLLGACER
jgi:hypothetical protein